jgi:hypothetical protein
MGMSFCPRYRLFLGLVFILYSGGANLHAQGQIETPAPTAKTTIAMPPAPLLPTNSHLAAADASVPQESAELQAVLKEDALIRRDARVTMVPIAKGSTSSGWVIAYQFDDATGAYAAYTYLRLGARPYNGEKVNATEAVKPDGELIYLSGTSVVRAKTRQYPDSVDGLLKQINQALPKATGSKALPPQLPTMLPKDGLEASSIRYALGPIGYQAMGGVLPAGILGWDKSAEVATADYRGDGRLTLLLYPTPQIAGDRGRAIEKAINAAGSHNFGTVKMRRVGPLVGVTSGHLSPERAEVLVQQLHLSEFVTFDQKLPLDFHVEVHKTATLLENIAIFSGILGGAAILLGLFLGGARAGIRVLQGKPAHTEPEFLTINLREQPKALLVGEPESGAEGGQPS